MIFHELAFPNKSRRKCFSQDHRKDRAQILRVQLRRLPAHQRNHLLAVVKRACIKKKRKIIHAVFLRFPRHKKVRKTSGNCMHADEWNNGVTKSSSLLNTSTLFSFERVIKKSPSIVGLTNTFWFGVESGIKNTHTHTRETVIMSSQCLTLSIHAWYPGKRYCCVLLSFLFVLLQRKRKKGLFHLCSWLGENYETICLFLFSLTRRDKKVSGKK